MSVGRRVARNFLFMFAAQAVAALAGLASTAFLARTLGPETFGVLGFGIALLSYFGHIVVLGTDQYGAREIARDHGAVGALVARILGLRAFSAMVALAVFLAVVAVLDQPRQVKAVMAIQGLGLLVTVIALDFVYQGLSRMAFIAGRQAAASVIVLVCVVTLIGAPDDVLIAAGIPVFATGLTALWLLARIHRRIAPVALSVGFDRWRPMLGAALPIAVSGAMSTIFFNTDIVMLGFMASPHEVGLYVGIYRIFTMSLLLGGLMAAVFAPELAGVWRDPAAMADYYRDFAGAMVLTGAPIAVAIAAFPQPVIHLIFDERFLAAAPVLPYLMIATMIVYVAYAASVCLIAWSDQTAQMIVLCCGAAANVALNLVLIPRYGIMGAASATLACQCVVTIGLLARLRYRFGLLGLGILAKPVICAVVAFAVARIGIDVALAIGPGWSDAARLLAGGSLGTLLYVALALATGAVEPRRLRAIIRDRFRATD